MDARHKILLPLFYIYWCICLLHFPKACWFGFRASKEHQILSDCYLKLCSYHETVILNLLQVKLVHTAHFTKCQMLQDAIVTAPCPRYTSIPEAEPILFLPHFHLFLTYIFPQLLSLLAQLQPYYYAFSRDLHFLQVLSPIQLPYNYHLPTSPLDSSPSPSPSPPRSSPVGSVNSNIFKYGFESAAISLPVTPVSSPNHPACFPTTQGAQNLASQQGPTICDRTLKATQDWRF